MIIFCRQCGKQYNVDMEGIENTTYRFNCRYCDDVVFVEKKNEPIDINNQLKLAFENNELSSDKRKASTASFTPKSLLQKPLHGNTKGYKYSLVTKVIGLMLIVCLIPLVAVWWVSIREISFQITEDTENILDQVTSDLSLNVIEWIDKNIRVLQAMSELEGITSMDSTRQTAILEAIQKQYPWMYLVFTTNVEGMNIARSDDKPLKDYSDRRYYKDVLAGNREAWQVLIGKTSGKPSLVLAIPIVKDDLIIGVLASAMTLEDLSQRIANWRRGDTGLAFLVDDTGKVVAHQDRTFVKQQKDLGDHPLIHQFTNGKIGTHYFQNKNEVQFIGNVHGTKYGWALAVQQNREEAFAHLQRARWFMMVVFFTAIFIVILVSWILGRTIAIPIRRLTEAAERISVGELDIEFKITSNDEIAALGRAIKRMQDSIRLSIERFKRRRML